MRFLSAHDNKYAGVTLIELLIVVAIIGLVFFPLLLTYRGYRTNQALLASAEEVANHARSVHIFSRESYKLREWGIKNSDSSNYSLYSSGASGELIENNYRLENNIYFEENFDVLFQIGSGEASLESAIKLIADNGQKMQVNINKSGVVEVQKP